MIARQSTHFGAFSPRLTEPDPALTLEGNLDPLGLYAIADALGVALAPGVRERQARPRYLTACAVGSVVCDGIDRDRIASDGVSPPWQVYEWYAVEAFVRTLGADGELRGVPGRDKVSAAVKSGAAVCARTYLKTPSVFGFHGIYRILGETLKVFDDVFLLDAGVQLLEAWERDQGLTGFHQKSGDAGARARQITEAVIAGLEAGRTDRSVAWSGWSLFRDHLYPFNAGPREREFLWGLVVGSESLLRSEIGRFIVSDAGARVWDRSNGSERMLHQALRRTCTGEMGVLIDAIGAYERFSRLLQDAFDECLWAMTKAHRPQSATDLGTGPAVGRAATELPDSFVGASDCLAAVGQGVRFLQQFRDFGGPFKPAELVELLIKHHQTIQARKPPSGKNPWFDQMDDGAVMVRPAYRRTDPPLGGDVYVHQYRTNPLRAFATDLGALRSG